MQKQLIEIVKGSHKGYKCAVNLFFNDTEVNPRDKIYKCNYYGKLSQYILSGIKNNTVFKIEILDPTKKGAAVLTSIKLVYNDKFKFCKVAYKDNDLYSFYGCFKMVKAKDDVKARFSYSTSI